MKEVKIIVKFDDTTLTEKFVVYEDFVMSSEDKFLKQMVSGVLAKCKEQYTETPEIIVKVTMDFLGTLDN